MYVMDSNRMSMGRVQLWDETEIKHPYLWFDFNNSLWLEGRLH